MKIDLTCPIELFAFELPTQERPACSLTFFNLENKQVSSVQVTLTCLDKQGNLKQRVVERVMDLKGGGRENFVADVPLEDDPDIAQIDLVVEKVWFDDATIWRRDNASTQEYIPNIIPEGRRREMLRFVAGADAVGYPEVQGPVWLCVCGRANAATETVCRRCERAKDEVIEKYSEDAVDAVIQKREAELEEIAQRARQEASEKEYARQQELLRRRRRRRIVTGTVAAVVVVAAGAYATVTWGIPEFHYQYGKYLLRNDQAVQAKEAFLNLGDYRDAAVQADEAEYAIALALIAEGDEASLVEAQERLAALKLPQASEQEREARYLRALLYQEELKYEEAEALLADLAGYKEADAHATEISYALAGQAMQAEDYEGALARYAALADYQDADARRTECTYLLGAQRLAAEAYEEAAQLFSSIPQYEDAQAKASECLYLGAGQMMEAGAYEQAMDAYAQLGTYEDAPLQLEKAKYAHGVALMNDGAYEAASEMFKSLGEYEDAQILWQEALYLPGMASLGEGDYETAAGYLERIPDYKDAQDQALRARYLEAEKLAADEQYDEAIARYEALGEYEGAASRAQQTRYLAAQQALEAGKFDEAARRFEALGKYSDASRKVLEANYGAADKLFAVGDFERAQVLFEALGSYQDARERALACPYAQAQALEAEEKLQEAAAKYREASGYQDADARAKASLYRYAEQRSAAGDPEEPGEVFLSLGDYEDAQERAAAVYDDWLEAVWTDLNLEMDVGNYAPVVEGLKPYVGKKLPAPYDGIDALYEAANYHYAKKLIDAGSRLEAMPYLQASNGYKDSQKLLKGFVYLILGSWTREGADESVEFRPDGTCTFDGGEYYFDVNGYALMIGDAPHPAERTHAIVSMDEERMTLKREKNGETMRFTRAQE